MSNTDVWNLARKPSIGTCGWHVKNPYYTNKTYAMSGKVINYVKNNQTCQRG
ncbi:MAG: hypothetical protein MRQ07_05780 [Candidatus Midichloria sp.]|nr:hypothetical protein [Candidatus Midichloria sp.]